MKNMIIILLPLLWLSCHKEDETPIVKEVMLDSLFTVSANTIARLKDANLDIAILGFDDYSTHNYESPLTMAYLSWNNNTIKQDFLILHYMDNESFSYQKLDSMADIRSAGDGVHFRERAIIDHKYALYFKKVYFSWDKPFIKDKVETVKVDSARFIITRIE